MPVQVSLATAKVKRFLYAQMTRFLRTIGTIFAYKRHTLVEQHTAKGVRSEE